MQRGLGKDHLGYDFAEPYKHAGCDGKTFRRKHDGETLARVKSTECVTMFGIGRLLVEARQDIAATGPPS